MNVKPRTVGQRPPRPTADSSCVDPVGESIKRRVARWEAKHTPERVSAILTAKVERMRERFRVQTEMLGRVEHRISEVTDAAGVSVITRMWYKDFGREVCRVWRTIPSSCQEREYDVVRYKWTARGLEPTLLAKVKVAVIELLDSSNFPRKNEEPCLLGEDRDMGQRSLEAPQTAPTSVDRLTSQNRKLD